MFPVPEAPPGNREPEQSLSPTELYLSLPGPTINTGSLHLPWAINIFRQGDSFPRMSQNILRRLKLESQSWIVLEFGAMLKNRRPRQRKVIRLKKCRKAVKFHNVSKPHKVFILKIYHLYISKHN